MAISTAFLSLFTLGMAFVIFFQLRATQHSERAWMIGNPEFNNFTGPPKPANTLLTSRRIRTSVNPLQGSWKQASV